MTVSDLPVESLPPWPVHPTTSSTQPASQKPTDTDGAAAGSWTRSLAGTGGEAVPVRTTAVKVRSRSVSTHPSPR